MLRQRRLNLLSGLSLILCLTALVLWMRSYWRVSFAVRYSRAQEDAAVHTDQIELRNGRILLIHDVWDRGGDVKCEYELHDFPINECDEWNVRRSVIGFGRLSDRNPSDMVAESWQVAAVPCWFIFGGVAATAIYLTRRSLAPAQPVGACPVCGYDLRATPDRCPECGTKPAKNMDVA